MRTYGTIPSTSGGSNIEYLSRAKGRLESGLGTRRPWKEMFNLRSISLPSSFGDAIKRIRTNVAYFQMNYTIVVLLILVLSLLWHRIFMIVLIATMVAWLFLYFLCDEPLVIFHRMICDPVVMIVLLVVTVVLLLLIRAKLNILVSVVLLWLTRDKLNILVSLLIGVVIVVVHASFRKTDDLFLDEEAAETSGLLTSKILSGKCVVSIQEQQSDGVDGEMEKGGVECGTVCCVCMDREKGAAFDPCGHTFCSVCSRVLRSDRGSCPLCNGPILTILDIHI